FTSVTPPPLVFFSHISPVWLSVIVPSPLSTNRGVTGLPAVARSPPPATPRIRSVAPSTIAFVSSPLFSLIALSSLDGYPAWRSEPERRVAYPFPCRLSRAHRIGEGVSKPSLEVLRRFAAGSMVSNSALLATAWAGSPWSCLRHGADAHAPADELESPFSF